MFSKQGQGGGARRRLSSAEASRLQQLLSHKQTFWGLDEMARLLTTEFGISYSLRHLRRLLKAMGMFHYKPQPVDYRRDPEAAKCLQQRLQATFDVLHLQGIAPSKICIGLADETGNYLHCNTARMWSFHKKIARKVNTSKVKINTLGFYALQGHSASFCISSSCQEELLRVLSLIRNLQKDYQAVVLIWDNLPAHHAKAVEKWAYQHQIYLVYNAAYAPDINPIEKIWKQLKKSNEQARVDSQPR